MKRWIRCLIYLPAIWKLRKQAMEAEKQIKNLDEFTGRPLNTETIEEIHSRISSLCKEYLTCKTAINFLVD